MKKDIFEFFVRIRRKPLFLIREMVVFFLCESFDKRVHTINSKDIRHRRMW